jgi:hypothetical protein
LWTGQHDFAAYVGLTANAENPAEFDGSIDARNGNVTIVGAAEIRLWSGRDLEGLKVEAEFANMIAVAS